MGGTAPDTFNIDNDASLTEQQARDLQAALGDFQSTLQDDGRYGTNSVQAEDRLRELAAEAGVEFSGFGDRIGKKEIAELEFILDSQVDTLEDIRGAREASGVSLPGAFEVAAGSPTRAAQLGNTRLPSVMQTVERAFDALPQQVKDLVFGSR